MSLPYFPFFPSDFEAKTSHLTIAEDGAYNRLLRLCWMTPRCSIPADPEWIARRLRVSDDEFEASVKPVLREFFKLSRGRYYNPRLREEWKKASCTHASRSKAGSKGGKAQAAENKQKEFKPGLSNQNQNQNITPLTPQGGKSRTRFVGVSEEVANLARAIK